MFEDTMCRLDNSRNEFNNKVQDAFAKSIDSATFESARSILRTMENAHEEAQSKISEIRTLTSQLKALTW